VYLHQICAAEDLGFFLRQGKLCACTACQLLAELLALKRFNSAEWPQFLSRRFNTIGQSDRLT
jgi:hypothetical protein